MKLDRYLATTTEERFARRARTTNATINRLRHNQRRTRVSIALRIEMASEGKVRAEELPMSSDDRRTVREFRRWLSNEDGRASA